MQMNRAERRRIEKVADRIDIGGCDLCHSPLGGPVPHHFGHRLGKLVGVCEGCIAKLDRRPLWSGLFDKAAPWQEDDRKWFEENSGRSFRLRLPIGQEVAAMEMETGKACPPTPPGRCLAVAVGQRERGFRVRHIAFLDAPLGNYSECDIEGLLPNFANVGGRC
jgi:hypothetical protein